MKYLSLLFLLLLLTFIHPPAFAMSPSISPSIFYCVGNNPQPPCATVAPSQQISAAPSLSTSPGTTVSQMPSPATSPSLSQFPESNTSPSPAVTGTPTGNNTGQFCADFSQLLNNLISTKSQSVNSKVHIKCHSSGGSKKQQGKGNSGNNGGNNGINPNNGWLSKFIALLLQLFLQILQLCGNQAPSVIPTPSVAPSSPIPSSGGGGTISSVPSSVPGISAAPTIYGTSPAPSNSPSRVPSGSSTGSGTSVVPNGSIPGNWSLVFDDEFNGSSLNRNNWAPIADGGESMENNVAVSASNVSVSGGDLILTLSSSSLGANVTSDPNEVGSGKGFQFGNGYYLEARIYFPGASTTNLYNWPAFWTSGHNWPATGEIDIAEVGNGPLTTSYHCANGSGSNCGTATPGGSWGNAWHTYGVDRESNADTVYWDGKKVATFTPSDGGANEYFLINVGNSTGPQCNCGGPSVYGTGSQVKIDYVRAWKKQ